MKLKSYGDISYDYDYLGRRISKVITNDKSYKYNYDIRGNMVSEVITSNNITTIIKYLYDVNNNVYGLIYNGNIYYYVKNILGEILYIIDEEGYIITSYRYDAFGNILLIDDDPNTPLGNINHIVYKSYYIDFENELYYLKSRYYNPSWGRFISSDKIEFLDPSVASGLNLYVYCLNNPVMYDDPEGTIVWWAVLLFVVVIVLCLNLSDHDGYIPLNSELNYMDDPADIIDDAINYRIDESVSGEPVIHIEDSFNITNRTQKEQILKEIINSEQGKQYGLSEENIDYYVKEWAVHNAA